MVELIELRITPDGKYLVVSAKVPDNDYYADIYILDIIINTEDTFDTSGGVPNITTTDKGVSNDLAEALKTNSKYKDLNAKSIYKAIDLEGLASNNHIYFVFVTVSGTYADGTPCSLKESITMGVAYLKYLFYKQGMNFAKNMEGCDFNRNYLDFMLKYCAFRMALETGNYVKAIEYWKSFFSDNKEISLTKSCGCNG